jgi:hypothetical protein
MGRSRLLLQEPTYDCFAIRANRPVIDDAVSSAIVRDAGRGTFLDAELT